MGFHMLWCWPLHHWTKSGCSKVDRDTETQRHQETLTMSQLMVKTSIRRPWPWASSWSRPSSWDLDHEPAHGQDLHQASLTMSQLMVKTSKLVVLIRSVCTQLHTQGYIYIYMFLQLLFNNLFFITRIFANDLLFLLNLVLSHPSTHRDINIHMRMLLTCLSTISLFAFYVFWNA